MITTTATEEVIDYSQYTVAQLKQMLDDLGIYYPSNALKADLVKLMEGG